jgi:hypothetical protein
MKILILMLFIFLGRSCFGQVKENRLSETANLILNRYESNYYLCVKNVKYPCFVFNNLEEFKTNFTNFKNSDFKIKNYKKTVMLLGVGKSAIVNKRELKKLLK